MPTMPTMPTSPPNPSSIHQVESIQSVGSVGSVASIHPENSNIPYWYCPLCTPSLTLSPSSLKCLQKSNPGIHRKCIRCFKCFGCFRCFISLLDHKTARFWSKSELNPKNRYPPASAISWLRKTPKKEIRLLVYEHDTTLCAIDAVVVRRSRLLIIFHPTGYYKIKTDTYSFDGVE